MSQAQRHLKLLAKALARLDEAVTAPAVTLKDRESRIVRFSFSYELMWKAFQRALADDGIVANSPRAALREAFRQGWINDEQAWLDMVEDRNLLAHTYDEDKAIAVSDRVPRYRDLLAVAYEQLTGRSSDNRGAET